MNNVLFNRTADEYARHRPAPPSELVPLLTRFARCRGAPSVVDLGCGTGLSTSIWRDHAGRLVGVDASDAMLAVARATYSDVSWILGDASATGLSDASADIVVAVQSLHWMEPLGTFREVGRILRAGGVFAAVDTRFPPAIDPELDVVFEDYLRRAAAFGEGDAPRWSKERHCARLRESGFFRHVREVQLHTIERGDARRFLAFARTAVDVPGLLARGVSAAQLGLDALGEVAGRVLGEAQTDWIFGYQVRIAVR